jgi:hypothetical protein
LPGDERRLESVTAQRLPEVGPTGDSGLTLHNLWNITRRRFLGYAAATSAATYLATATRLEDVLAKAGQWFEVGPRFTLVRSFSAWARRRDDLLSIRFDFYNLLVDASDPANPRLVRKPNTAFAYIVAVFWPQNVGEQAFQEDLGGGPAPEEPPVQSILARESRLAFLVPDGANSIPYRLEELLKWTSFKPSVVPVAQLNGPRAMTDLKEPLDFETALDLPFRLVLSPHEESRWKHATAPVTRSERTELWHTRLVLGPDMDLDEPDPARRTLRAIWARDVNFAGNVRDQKHPAVGAVEPFRMSLDGPGVINAEVNRFDIVMNNAVRLFGFFLRPPFRRVIYEPAPIKVDRLMLTALGAWIDVEAHWDGQFKPFDNDLIEWRHRGTMGRDHYAKLVHKGYLFPYGHPAVLITITERKFNFAKGGTLGAFLRQRDFIVVLKPDKAYSSAKAGELAPQQKFDGRSTPFRNIRFTTLVTPPLDPHPNAPFTPMVGGAPLLFHAIGTDWGGQQAEFTTTMWFVEEKFAKDTMQVDDLINNKFVEANLFGQKVNLAEIDEVRKIDTAQQLMTVKFGGEPPVRGTESTNLRILLQQDQPGFYPKLVEAEIRMAAAEQLSGSTFLGTKVEIPDVYRVNGFDGANNKGELYAVLKTPAAEMRFPADRSGGVMTPNLNITGLSRLLGPVADHDKIATGQFRPDQYFTGAKLMGGLKLSDIVQPFTLVPSPHALAPARLLPVPAPRTGNGQVGMKRIAAAEVLVAGPAAANPHSITFKPPKPFEDDDDDDDENTKALKITSGFAYEDGNDKPPTAVVTKIKWKPELKKDPLHIFEPSTSSDPDKKSKAVIKAKIRQDLKIPDKTDLEVKGKVENFNLNLFGDQGAFHILTFEFNKLEFTAATGSGLDVNPDIEKVSFHGILTFVEKLKDLMGKSAGPFSFGIEPVVAPPAIKAHVSLSIPDVTVGAFSFSHMKFSFICTIPFTDKPIRFRFEFCNRDHPFLVTVYIFGGGGFFGIAIGTDGFEMFEAAIEFGAAASLNFGVASGSASVMAGIYFKMEEEKPSNNQKTTLTGYFRANGNLSVLGIIEVSIELYLGLSYEFETHKVTGTAKLTIEVSVLFFSISVEIKVERKFGGTGDPNFLDMHNQSSWNEYADAFAA